MTGPGLFFSPHNAKRNMQHIFAFFCTGFLGAVVGANFPIIFRSVSERGSLGVGLCGSAAF